MRRPPKPQLHVVSIATLEKQVAKAETPELAMAHLEEQVAELFGKATFRPTAKRSVVQPTWGKLDVVKILREWCRIKTDTDPSLMDLKLFVEQRMPPT